MSTQEVEYRAANVPAGLPSCDSIVQLCDAAGFYRSGICFEIEGIPRFWIKYGVGITLGEALTQGQVAKILNADPTSVVRVPEVYLIFLRAGRRYIVMQHVAGDTVATRRSRIGKGKYVKDDVSAVAAAFKQLISIRVPAGTQPGHVGGGSIGHDFFYESKSTFEYPTVGHLQAQINALVVPQGISVDFSSETADGLILCPSDIDPSNFIIDSQGMVFAIDFSLTGYMPPSYVSYSLEVSSKIFARMVAQLINYPKSINLQAMQVAAGILLISGNNSLGVDGR